MSIATLPQKMQYEFFGLQNHPRKEKPFASGCVGKAGSLRACPHTATAFRGGANRLHCGNKKVLQSARPF